MAKTRLKNQADFYSFFGAIAELNRQEELATDEEICRRISSFMAMVDNQEERIKDENKKALEYYNAFKSSTTDSGSRKTRIDIMKSVIQGSNILSTIV